MTTAYCYDPLYLAHDLAGHPENRTRLERVMTMLADEGLLARMTLGPPRPVASPAAAIARRSGITS